MSGFLFNSIIFGPVRSRRLGSSLGINLLPTTFKVCSFNCIYCECGWTEDASAGKAHYYPTELIRTSLESRLTELRENQSDIDSITFAGNGEPTLHPEFPLIIDNTISLRDQYAPDAKVSVLSNSSMISKPTIRESLMKVNNIMKLDAGSEELFQLINNPGGKLILAQIVEDLKKFDGRLIIQTMFVRGTIGEIKVDNTEAAEVEKWLKHLEAIHPEEVMIYSLDRVPPLMKLGKIGKEELLAIAGKVQQLNLKVAVY
jgi:wyosine [tRNA(Phe)-imidazoG37] synthetase (radical SAM superfamily)